jgi:FXSXX-COOH protein
MSVLDVSGLSLDVILRSGHSPDSALTAALRRVMADMRSPGESYAAHDSAIPEAL